MAQQVMNAIKAGGERSCRHQILRELRKSIAREQVLPGVRHSAGDRMIPMDVLGFS